MGVSNFDIKVGSTFDPANVATSVGGFTSCLSYTGYPKHGNVDNIFTCSFRTEGRYVAIEASNQVISICEFDVYARSGRLEGCMTILPCVCYIKIGWPQFPSL